MVLQKGVTCCLALGSTKGLMNHNPRVWQGVTLALYSRHVVRALRGDVGSFHPPVPCGSHWRKEANKAPSSVSQAVGEASTELG